MTNDPDGFSLTIHAVAWMLWLMAFIGYEFYALGNPDPKFIPLTHFVRELASTHLIIRAGITFLTIWLFFHFGGRDVFMEVLRLPFARWLS